MPSRKEKETCKSVYSEMIRLTSNHHCERLDIEESTPGFFRSDSIHLSDIGLDMYNDTICETLRKHTVIIRIFWGKK
jgi:hypothetical protein